MLARFEYSDLGQISKLTRGNGTVTNFGIAADGRLTSLLHNMNSADSVQRSFTYSNFNQITAVDATNASYSWQGAVSGNRGYTVNGLNQYTQAGTTALSYDANGNLTHSGSDTYTYDAENKMATMNGHVLGYDPLGFLQYVEGRPTLVSQADGSIIAEVSGSTIQRRFVYAPGLGTPILWYEGASTSDRRWLHADERGSVVAVSNATGSVTNKNSYDEFGIPSASNVGLSQYTGQAWIPEIGLYYYKARMYSPALGRFMQTDPIGYGDGVNWYNYVGGDPVNAVDPDGLEIVVTDKPGGVPMAQRVIRPVNMPTLFEVFPLMTAAKLLSPVAESAAGRKSRSQRRLHHPNPICT